MSDTVSLASVTNKFRTIWKCEPTAIARAPGRVNLIGEHIDYEGYGVMPMAIEQACFVAIGWQAGGQGARGDMHVANIAPEAYPTAVLPLPPGDALPADTPPWITYVQAAYKGCAEFAASKQQPASQQGNMLLMVGSSIPPAAGVSSSSALVVATALAVLALWGLPASPSEVAEFTCKCERFVGTQGGGMDQAISLLAQAGRAMHVQFNPVRADPVPLPPGCMFVVANSLAPSAKAETASYRFNLRVLECRLAAMLLAHQLCETAGEGCSSPPGVTETTLQWEQVSILKQVEPHLLQRRASCTSSNSCSGADPAVALSAAVQELLPEASYTLQQVAQQLSVSCQQLMELLPQGLQAAAAEAPKLHLQQRACHVFTEAQRVLTFKQICQDPQLPAGDKLQQLGDLLNASHSSCAELYQCSCEELDKLVDTARAAGALGARLTGAGWGGCIIALVPESGVAAFKQQVFNRYYKPLVAAGVITKQQVASCLFATSPSAGAQVLHLGIATQAGGSPQPAEPVLATA